ncbi:MAG: cation-transporting P-type ATPase, partial [Chloroflexales bacterium]|nr:cation-transporting P-type ATPase [Chloroflexales bacterium]
MQHSLGDTRTMTTQQEKHKPHALPELSRTAWHTLSGAETLEQLAVSREGLSGEAASIIQQQVGKNTFPTQEPPSLWSIILHQFLSPLIYILIAAAVVSLAIGEVTDAVFIFIVLLINAGLGTYQEFRAEQNAAALQRMLKIYATVRRDGREQTLDAEELAPGDIVLLESGNRVPADLRLLDTHNLTVDESFLTGESAAANKQANLTLAAETEVNDRNNMAYAGATALSGRGVGVVVATALHTEIGKIAAATTQGEATKAPLVVRMDQFVRYISFAVLGAVALLVAIAVWQGVPFTEVFFLSVALAVSAIPEGLPVAMTVALSIAAYRMAQRRVIARKMTAVEGLGSCTLIASD